VRRFSQRYTSTINKKALSLLLLGTIACFVAVVNVNAYDLTPSRWSSNKLNPLYYYVNSQWSEFATARNDWNNAGTHIGSFYSIANPEYAWVSVTKVTDSGVTWPGRCLVMATGGWIDAVDIELNDYYSSTLGTDGRRTVCAHEIGHCFSLKDENDLWCLMHQGALDRVAHGILGPQDDDISGVNAAY